MAQFGTNNPGSTAAVRVNDIGGAIPLWLPQCGMLTDTVRWNGASLLGTSEAFTSLNGFPGHDILQQQDALPITAWSINASTGVTTFTVPAYAAHNILAQSDYINAPSLVGIGGDSVVLGDFAASSFFNGQTVNIATHPTPTTFTVNSGFGQSTSSGTDFGVAKPTTTAGQPGMRQEFYSLNVNSEIDPSFTWTWYNAAGSSTVEPPYYRPILENTQRQNNPLQGWGNGATNGTSIITQNSAVVCSPNLGRIPAVGAPIVYPYQTGGMFVTTVSSTAGSCSSGYTARTLASPFPNTSGYTANHAEWFTYTTPQTLAVAIPGTISLPLTIQLALPFPPSSSFENGVSSHGRIEIGNQQWDYMGDNFGGTAGGLPTITLRNGPTSVNGGSGYGVGSVVFPVNPCQAMYNQPWPVVPSPDYVSITGWSITSNVATFTANNNYVAGQIVGQLNFVNVGLGFNGMMVQVVSATTTSFTMNLTHANASGGDSGVVLAATPRNADYYAGDCAGAAGISLPMADANAYSPFTNDGINSAHFKGIGGNPIGTQNANGATLLYEGGNYSGYGNTFDGLNGEFLWAGFVQGPSSVNMHGVRLVGPTSTGQNINNCTFRTNYAIVLDSMEQSNINRCDTYSTEVSPYDGSSVGSSMGLNISYTLSELDGGGVTGTSQFAVRDYNNEPEGGSHEEFPASVQVDANIVVYEGTIFEGGYNIFGGSFQILHGTQLSVPVFNYGSNNYFEHMSAVTPGYKSTVYNGNGFYNWGAASQGECASAAGTANQVCGIGFVQGYNGHDAWATMMGNVTNPNENLLGGMVLQGEFQAAAGIPLFTDATELWWASHFNCTIGSGLQCGPWSQFGGFSSYIYIGPHERNN